MAISILRIKYPTRIYAEANTIHEHGVWCVYTASLTLATIGNEMDNTECKSCGFVIIGKDTDVASKEVCINCGKIVGAEPIILFENCLNCGYKMSKRAKKCPKCSSPPLAVCQICGEKIDCNSSNCPECGDPEPFGGEHIKERSTYDQAALTSHYAKQESERPATTTNARNSGFSLRWFLFSFDGRIGRQAFWCAYPVIIFLAVIISDFAIESLVEFNSLDDLIIFLAILVFFLWPSLAIQVKRWHDRNKSANWIFLSMIPYIGFIWSTIELLFLKGTEGSNDYGKDPLSK